MCLINLIISMVGLIVQMKHLLLFHAICYKVCRWLFSLHLPNGCQHSVGGSSVHLSTTKQTSTRRAVLTYSLCLLLLHFSDFPCGYFQESVVNCLFRSVLICAPPPSCYVFLKLIKFCLRPIPYFDV